MTVSTLLTESVGHPLCQEGADYRVVSTLLTELLYCLLDMGTGGLPDVHTVQYMMQSLVQRMKQVYYSTFGHHKSFCTVVLQYHRSLPGYSSTTVWGCSRLMRHLDTYCDVPALEAVHSPNYRKK